MTPVILSAGIILVQIMIGSAQAKTPPDQAMVLKPARLPDPSQVNRNITRDQEIRIAAIRVDFVRDTIETTTGDGGFNYAENDTFYFDPPPHDAQYFSDHLEFLRFYWDKMSNGSVSIDWEIFPAGSQASYRLPKQMWQYNWNYTDEQLDRGLAELFRDAVTAADEDPAILWQDYDLVIVFHAGSGAEFDLGYTMTPHDIPSAWMVREDFNLIGMENGIPVDDGQSYVTGGLILPETETHDDIQISVSGVICSLFGHWLGLPALYDRDDGKPVVGKWSLMDRGFGNFYGAVPGYLDAWSRSYMGWIDPVEISPGQWTIAGNEFTSPEVPESYLVRISEQEYFLLENRARDPENDSIAVAWDRSGNRMVFNDDYTVTPEPGFRVPVRIDNLDFDSPGSGILIWHVDESLIPLVQAGRFNSIDERRGLDLEEADGAQDIGREYAFLTAGYGTDYGIFTDAWFRSNEHHQNANQGRQVSFNSSSYPSSLDNAGALTGITIDSFSDVDTLMTFNFLREGYQFDRPVVHGFTRSPVLAIGNFDDTDEDDEIALISNDTARFYDGDGGILSAVPLDPEQNSSLYGPPVVRDLNGNGYDEIIWRSSCYVGDDYLNALVSGPVGDYVYLAVDSIEGYFTQYAAGGYGLNSTLCIVSNAHRTIEDSLVISSYNADLVKSGYIQIPGHLLSLHRFGSADSDTFLISTNNGEFYLWHNIQLTHLAGVSDFIPDDLSLSPVLVDMDGSGEQDLIVFYIADPYPTLYTTIIHDPLQNGMDNVETYTVSHRFLGSILQNGLIPADFDGDDAFELLGFAPYGSLAAIEKNGVLTDNFPWDQASKGACHKESIRIADFNGDNRMDVLFPTSYTTELTDRTNTVSSYSMDILTGNRQHLPGFPVSLRTYPYNASWLCQLDDDPQMEFLVVSKTAFDAFEIRGTSEDTRVWWQGEFRDNDRANAIWEPAVRINPDGSASLLPDGLCYNWPNPARGMTYIRYTLNFPAVVTVDIYDIAGDKVTTLRGSGSVGIPSEIAWDLSGIARGGYIAMVKAEGDGRSETRMIKIAVR